MMGDDLDHGWTTRGIDRPNEEEQEASSSSMGRSPCRQSYWPVPNRRIPVTDKKAHRPVEEGMIIKSEVEFNLISALCVKIEYQVL